MDAGGEIPRCSHGRIILGCPVDDCLDQNAYLALMKGAADNYNARQVAAARKIVREMLGLPT